MSKWIFIAITVFVIIKTFKKKSYRRNYSLGLKLAEDAESLIKQKKYKEAENLVSKQSLNDITQVVDHLALCFKEKVLTEWNTSTNSDLAKLTLGVFYLHLAWISRSHKLAKDVSKKKAEDFFDYLDLSYDTFDTISENSFYSPELNSRKIRLYMSYGNNETAGEYFNEVSKNQSNFIWPFIHYAELIQPKWGSDIKDLEDFYENLPENFLIQSIVETKLILDSMIMDENYFSKYNINIKSFAKEKVLAIDADLNAENTDSIHKYILYNYMILLSDEIGDNTIKSKYKKLKDGNYTLYPHGLV